ncbi:unnamed protein product [Malus baccata var. baccata]
MEPNLGNGTCIIWRSHQTSIFIPPDFFNNRCLWPDVTIGEALVGWWRGFMLVTFFTQLKAVPCCIREKMNPVISVMNPWTRLYYWSKYRFQSWIYIFKNRLGF